MGCLVAVLLRIRHVVQVRDGRIGAVVFLWACYQLILGFTDPLIANFAHLGGFVAGFLLGLVVPSRTWPKLDVLPIS
jgi:membrane associated rhomboid family serine protease